MHAPTRPFLAFCFAGAIAATSGCSSSTDGPAVKMVPARVATATDVGPLADAELITLVIGTKMHDEDQLDSTIASIRARLSRPLTAAEFGQAFGVDEASYADLIAWAEASGLEVVRKTDSRTTLTVRGMPSTIASALNVGMRRYADSKGEFYSADREPDLNSGALKTVSSIGGLSNAHVWHSHMNMHPNYGAETIPTPFPMNGYAAADLRKLYGVSTAKTAYQGAGEHIAILGVGAPLLDTNKLASGTLPMYDTPQLVDLAMFLGATPTTYKQVQVGVSGTAQDDGDETLIENTLDAEMVLTFAPAANVDHVLVTSNAIGLFEDGMSFIVNDPSEATARAVSVSFGSCESFAGSEVPIENALLAQAIAQGQQWFFASGDDGIDTCNDGPNSDIPTLDWPASSPYALAVGGTGIYLDSKMNDVEAAWGDGAEMGGAAGGGPSALFAKPSWQVGVTPADGARDVPDVAALAGYPGIEVDADGMPQPVDGTSAATPMWAGIWGIIDGASNGSKGFTQGPIDLYTLAPKSGIRDITGNNNGVGTKATGYNAGTGYDLVSGLGAPDVLKLTEQKGWK